MCAKCPSEYDGTECQRFTFKTAALEKGSFKKTCTMCVGDNFRFAKPSAIKNVSAHSRSKLHLTIHSLAHDDDGS